MANFGYCTDLFSPIQSDISLDSLAGTPDLDTGLENKYNDMDSSTEAFLKSPTKKCVSTLNMLMNDAKEQSDTHTEKEEKFKDTYNQLKQSMDDLYYKKATNLSILSPILMTAEIEKMLNTEGDNCESKEKIKKEKFISPEKTDSLSFILETSLSLAKKYETEPEKPIGKTNRETKVKNVPQSKDLAKKSSNKASLDSETRVKSREKCTNKKTGNTDIVSSSKKCASLDGHSLNTMLKAENLLQNHKKCVASLPVENKGMSIEKSIQIAVGMEFDKIRGLMLDQNISLRKELLKIQDMAKKQNEVSGLLISMIEHLVEENKKLMSKHS